MSAYEWTEISDDPVHLCEARIEGVKYAFPASWPIVSKSYAEGDVRLHVHIRIFPKGSAVPTADSEFRDVCLVVERADVVPRVDDVDQGIGGDWKDRSLGRRLSIGRSEHEPVFILDVKIVDEDEEPPSLVRSVARLRPLKFCEHIASDFAPVLLNPALPSLRSLGDRERKHPVWESLLLKGERPQDVVEDAPEIVDAVSELRGDVRDWLLQYEPKEIATAFWIECAQCSVGGGLVERHNLTADILAVFVSPVPLNFPSGHHEF